MDATTPSSSSDTRIERMERLAYLLDDSIRLPGNYRIGYDALLGLLPGIGDAVGLVLSTMILVQAARLGVQRPTLLRMAVNVAIETVVGLVPLLGDLFDMAYKANLRNVDLAVRDLGGTPSRRLGSNRGFFVRLTGALMVLVIALAVLAALVVWTVVWLVQQVG